MKKITLIGVLALLCTLLSATAQEPEPLFINGRFPDISLGKFFNYKDSTATFRDFLGKDGKLIIFSFWNSGCLVCIRQFEHKNLLQKKYHDSIQLILVTSESLPSATETIAKWEKQYNTKLIIPVVIEDTTISKFIRQWNLPSYAWIARDGRMIAQTSADYVNDETISFILKETSRLRPRPIEQSRLDLPSEKHIKK